MQKFNGYYAKVDPNHHLVRDLVSEGKTKRERRFPSLYRQIDQAIVAEFEFLRESEREQGVLLFIKGSYKHKDLVPRQDYHAMYHKQYMDKSFESLFNARLAAYSIAFELFQEIGGTWHENRSKQAMTLESMRIRRVFA